MTNLAKAGQLKYAPLPLIDELAHGIAPHEFNVLVLPRAIEAKSASGFIQLPEDYLERESEAVVEGMLAAASPAAFSYAEWPDGADKPAAGAFIYFARYAGHWVTGCDGRKYRLMKDKDVLAVREAAAETVEGAWR